METKTELTALLRSDPRYARPAVLVSACLLGVHCRYNGGGEWNEAVAALARRAELIPVCPEILGGLPTPRCPSEIQADGRVMMQDGTDVTAAYERGAKEAVELARRFGCRLAVLKERSPSCGGGRIYDGSFTHIQIPGDGVAAALLKSAGIAVFGESDVAEALADYHLIKRVIGLTGGVGAGKSRVLDLLQKEFGAEILRADEIAAELEAPGQEGLQRLVALFGKEILNADGKLDRPAFAARIFADETALTKVNEAIHPLTWTEIQRRVHASRAQLIAVEAALFDEESRHYVDELWFVDTDEETRIARLMESRGYSREKCLDIMRGQRDRESFRQLADQVIDNSGSIAKTYAQLKKLLGEGSD